jgi:inorganic pyrophosphatase
MMDFSSVILHPGHPQKVWVIVEQPRNEPDRYSYDSVSKSFYRRPYTSVAYARGFSGVYGWVGGSGIPPASHHDVFLFTNQSPSFGDILVGHICGVFLRRNNDHKFIAVDDEIRNVMATADLPFLQKDLYAEMIRLYPRIDEGEGWHNAEIAFRHLLKQPLHD